MTGFEDFRDMCPLHYKSCGEHNCKKFANEVCTSSQYECIEDCCPLFYTLKYMERLKHDKNAEEYF